MARKKRKRFEVIVAEHRIVKVRYTVTATSEEDAREKWEAGDCEFEEDVEDIDSTDNTILEVNEIGVQ